MPFYMSVVTYFVGIEMLMPNISFYFDLCLYFPVLRFIIHVFILLIASLYNVIIKVSLSWHLPSP